MKWCLFIWIHKNRVPSGLYFLQDANHKNHSYSCSTSLSYHFFHLSLNSASTHTNVFALSVSKDSVIPITIFWCYPFPLVSSGKLPPFSVIYSFPLSHPHLTLGTWCPSPMVFLHIPPGEKEGGRIRKTEELTWIPKAKCLIELGQEERIWWWDGSLIAVPTCVCLSEWVSCHRFLIHKKDIFCLSR